MRKHSRKFFLAAWLVVALFACALLLESLAEAMRVLLMLAAAAVGCVWIACESRIDRAAAPLRIQQEPEERDCHPPDAGR